MRKHLSLEGIWRPIVEADRANDRGYITYLLEPTFGNDASLQATQVLSTLDNGNAKALEDALHKHILRKTMPELRISVSIFRSMCDRLVSLRMLNLMRENRQGCEFDKSYTPCVEHSPTHDWYRTMNVNLHNGEIFQFQFCEPDMNDAGTRQELLCAFDTAVAELTPTAGYFSLPEVRDRVCEYLKIPEAAFDEGINRLLDLESCPVTVGLQYEGISGRQKPLVRDRGATQIYNLIRRG